MSQFFETFNRLISVVSRRNTWINIKYSIQKNSDNKLPHIILLQIMIIRPYLTDTDTDILCENMGVLIHLIFMPLMRWLYPKLLSWTRLGSRRDLNQCILQNRVLHLKITLFRPFIIPDVGRSTWHCWHLMVHIK